MCGRKRGGVQCSHERREKLGHFYCTEEDACKEQRVGGRRRVRRKPDSERPNVSTAIVVVLSKAVVIAREEVGWELQRQAQV